MGQGLFIPPSKYRLLSTQYSNTDQLTANGLGSSITGSFATNFVLPANTLVANSVVRMTFDLSITSSATPSSNMFYLAAQKAPGTIVTLAATGSGASAIVPGNGQTRGATAQFDIYGTVAPAAAAAVDVAMRLTYPFSAIAGILNGQNVTTQPITMDTTVAQTLGLNIVYSFATAGNTCNVRQLIVELMGP
jgi:hypothetical protein